MKALRFVRAVHSTSLLGYERTGDVSHIPYVQLGQDKVPYDLNAPGAIAEIKAVLHALALIVPSWPPGYEAVTEKRWQYMTIDDPAFPTWDPATADEFALAIGRHKGLAIWAGNLPPSEPYATLTPVGPQPTATGLEVLAGAARLLLNDKPGMPLYRSWRGGWFDPPSKVSGPSASDPVVLCTSYGPSFLPTPASMTAEQSAAVVQIEQSLSNKWQSALEAPDEATRGLLASQMAALRSERTGIINQALAPSPPPGTGPAVEALDAQNCGKAGGLWDTAAAGCVLPQAKAAAGGSAPSVWAWLGVAAAGVVVYYAVRGEGGRW